MLLKVVEFLTEEMWPRTRKSIAALPRWTKKTILFVLILFVGAFLAYEIHAPQHALLFSLWMTATVLIAALASWSAFPSVDLPRGDHFGAPGAEITTLLDREPDAQRVLNVLRPEPAQLVIVTGPSGAGKSTLVRTILTPALAANGYRPIPIVGFEGKDVLETQFRATLGPSLKVLSFDTEPKFVRVADMEAAPLLIFDQFEQFLLKGREQPALLGWFRAFLAAWQREVPSSRCVLVVRQDLYFDLGFLRPEMDLFANTIEVRGLSPAPPIEGIDRDAEDRSKARGVLSLVVNDNETVNTILKDLTNRGPLLPLELQIVGLMLEDIKRRRDTDSVSVQEYETSLGGREGLIREYFLRHIHATPDAATAAAVLHALSVRRVVYRVTLAELQRVTHRRKRALGRVLASAGALLRGGLVLRSTSGAYQIAHDYLAQAFHDLSALQLEADDRDNIAYFSESRKPAGDAHEVDDVSTLALDAWYLALGLFLVARLVMWTKLPWLRDVERMTVGIPPVPTGLTLSFLDVAYLPSFFASFSSAVYTWQIYRHYLCRVPTNRGLMHTSIVLTGGMILAGTVWTSAWLVFASAAGLLIAGSLRAGYSGLGARWLLKYRNFLTQTTLFFFIYMMVALGLGLGLVALRYPWFGLADSVPPLFGYASDLALSSMILVFMFRSLGKHATADGGALMLGTRARMARR